MTLQERTEALVERHGEVCTKTDAGRILGRSVNTIKAMLADGRLDAACAGTMVDVRSIARYIMQPKQADDDARKARMMARRKSSWAV